MNPYWIDLDTPFFRECNEEAIDLYYMMPWLTIKKRGPDDDRLFVTGDILEEHGFNNLLKLRDMFEDYHSKPFTFAFFTSRIPWLPHIDIHGRGDNTAYAKCAANILFPVLNCDAATTTKWVEPEKEPYCDPLRDAWIVEEPYEVLHEEHITSPGMLNTAIPHGVWRTDDRLRVIGVFAINSTDHVTWEELTDVLRPVIHASGHPEPA